MFRLVNIREFWRNDQLMEINTCTITEDILTFYVGTLCDPQEKIGEAFDQLEHAIGSFDGRKIYGVAQLEGTEMTYKACVKESRPGEGAELGLPYHTIPKGDYLYTVLNNWQSNMQLFRPYFQQLMEHPDAKPYSFTLEDYFSSDDVKLLLLHK